MKKIIFLITLALVAPIWLLTVALDHRAQIVADGNQAYGTIWLPPNSGVRVEEKMLKERGFCVDDSPLCHEYSFNAYQKYFGEEGKHEVFICENRAFYQTHQGKISVWCWRQIFGKPVTVSVKGLRYLGEGRVVWETDNDWPSLVGICILCLGGGLIIDGIIGIIIAVLCVVCRKLLGDSFS
jgi:hypothetical protein